MIRRSERGVALVLVLLAMVLMTAIGIVLVLTTSAETRIAASFRGSEQALYAADSAAERAMADLRAVADWNTVLAGGVMSSFVDGPPSGTRVLDDGTIVDLAQVANLARCQKITACSDADMNAVTEDRPWGANNPRWVPYAYGRLRDLLPAGAIDSPFYVVAMVGDDPGETDNDPTRDSPADRPGGGVIALRAEAFGPAGAHRVIEMTIAHGARLATWREIR
jgi:hypothetical protein